MTMYRVDRKLQARTRWTSLWISVNVFCLAIAGLCCHQATVSASTWSTKWNSGIKYLDPVALAMSPDGSRLYVVCEGLDRLLVVNTRNRQVVGMVRVGRKPEGITLSPDGKTLYVTNEWSNSVSVVDASTLHVIRTLRAGWDPVGVTTDRAGNFLYTANTLGNDISVINLSTGQEIKRLAAGHFPEYIELSADGKWVYVSSLLAKLGPPDDPPECELTIISTNKQIVMNRVMVPGVIQLRYIAQVPARQGGYLLIPFEQPHNLVPLLRLQQGWYMSHGMAVIRLSQGNDQKARISELLLDNMDQAFANDFGAATTPDGKLALITASGANTVSVISIARLNQLLGQIPASNSEALSHRLDTAQKFVIQRLPTGRDPTAVVVSPNGQFAYVANHTDDTITVVNLRQLTIASTIDLGGPRQITVARRGEQLFYDASFAYQGQLSCSSCHPHGGSEDGLAWSLEMPVLGRNVPENRTLLAIRGTSPFDWNGINPNIQTQDGPRSAALIFRSQGFSNSQVRALVTYIRSLTLPPNPHVARDGTLTHSQEVGKQLFFRTKTDNGKIIPLDQRCYYCHSPLSHYTSRVRMDVGTSTKYDTIQQWDVPQLQGVWMRPPYLHNGEAMTLEEIWTKFNPDDKHGYTSDMNKNQLNDLIQFLKTL